MGSPFLGCQGLESETHTKLQLAHARRGTWRAVLLDVGNLTGGNAAVNAGVALVAVEVEDRVVKDVVRVEAELRNGAPGDGEVLGHGEV